MQPEHVLPVVDLTINEVIRRYPRTLAVFSRYGMDSCCGGALPVAEAAARHGLDPATLLAELERAVVIGK